MFSYFRKKREEKEKLKNAYELGQQIGGDIFNAIAKYMEPRLETVSAKYIQVFRGQMTKIYDEEIPPADNVRIQLRIFMDNVAEFEEKMREEVELATKEVFDYAEAAQCRDLAETFTRERVSQVAAEMIVEATLIAGETIQQLAETAH